MKRIVVLSGSGKKHGNTMKLVESIQTSFGDEDQFDWKYIYLYDYEIKGCIGCKACVRKDENACPFKDDVLSIMEVLKSADGIILASPVYSRAVTGQLKQFIDRTNYVLHRPSLIEIPTISVSTTDVIMSKKIANYLSVIGSSMGARIEGELAVKIGKMRNNPSYKSKVEKEIEKISKSFKHSVLEGKQQTPNMHQLMRFNGWKTRVIVSKEEYPNDYLYWEKNGWIDMDFFHKISLNPVTKVFFRIVNKRISKIMKTGFLKYN